MSGIRVAANGRIWDFDDQDAVRVGRNSKSDVQLEIAMVSRLHAELKHESFGWVLTDLGGANGTWIGEERVKQVVLGPSTRVRFGPPVGGADAVLTVLPEQTATPRNAPDTEKTAVVWSPPGGSAAPPPLLVTTRDGDRYFSAERVLRIGRERSLDVVANNPVVSRGHATVEPRRDGWWFVNQSRSGSFQDGEEVTAVRLSGPTTIFLGHPTGGYRIELVPMVGAAEARAELARRRQATKRSGRGAKILMSLVAILAVGSAGVGALAPAGSDDGDSPGNSAGSGRLEAAKKASVEIIAYAADGTALWSGSGSVINGSGLILTNAHVAAPEAPGAVAVSAGSASEYRVALATADDRPTEPLFKAETIVADGYLDLAVMKITSKVDGSPVKSGDIPAPIPLGDSAELSTGDPITALGFPRLTDDDPTTAESPLSVTRGSVSTFLSDPLTKTARAWIDSDVRIGSGNSGGASINEAGELIGINTQAWVASNVTGRGFFTSGSSRIRPIALASEVIRIAETGGDRNYVSPSLGKVPELTAGGWSVDGQAGCKGDSALRGVTTGQTIHAEFSVERIPDDMPVGFAFVSEQNGERTVLSEQQAAWTDGPGASCFTLPFEVPAGLTEVSALLVVGPNDDVVAKNLVRLN